MHTTIIPGVALFSVIPLVFANAVPLFGVLLFDWSLFHVLFLYWLESAVVGFYNILKLIKVGGFMSIFLVPFFVVHYGGFMVVHLAFIFGLFAPELSHASLFPPRDVVLSLLTAVALPFVVLLVSHGVSFLHNFIGKREYERTNVGKQMHAPYRRIILMHVTLIFGGWLIMLSGEPVLGLAFLVVIKTITDLRAHLKEHAPQEQATA